MRVPEKVQEVLRAGGVGADTEYWWQCLENLMPTLLYFLLGGALVSCVLFVVTERQLLEALCNNWRWLGLILLVTLLWRLPFDGHWFFGLEYEDSYIYSVSARYVNSGTITCSPGNSCYLTTVCVVGNQNSCRVSKTSSGHFLGYPLVIAIATRVFGYSPAMAAHLSLIASMATVVLIFLSGKLIGGETAGLAASVIFALTPVFAVQGVGAYAEPVSNMLVVGASFSAFACSTQTQTPHGCYS